MASKYIEMLSNLHSSKDAMDTRNTDVNLTLLKPLDEVLRCRICFEYFNNCMITKCSHNYCSVCIRRYMTYKSQCPTCFQDASEPELRNNRLIDEVLRLYIKIRESMENCIPSKSNLSAEDSKSGHPLNLKIKKVHSCTETHQVKFENEKEAIDPDSSEVSCPVCYRLVLKDRINVHLDTCLKVEEQSSEKKHLAKFVYHLLSDKEIRKKLKERGLSSMGDRQTLIRRHKNFTTLYNANCDSLNPKLVTELIQDIEAQELEERLNSFPKQVQVSKKSDISEIKMEHDTYVKQHQSQFNALIEDVQQREIAQSVVKREILDESTDNCGTISNKEPDIYRDIVGESSVCEKKSSKSAKNPIVSQSVDKSTCKTSVDEKSKMKEKEVLVTVNIKQEPVSPSIPKETTPFLTKMDKIQDSFTDDSSSSSLDDFERSKIELNLLRKRKKDRRSSGVGTQHSPKRK